LFSFYFHKGLPSPLSVVENTKKDHNQTALEEAKVSAANLLLVITKVNS
jgi:hypothetical protein